MKWVFFFGWGRAEGGIACFFENVDGWFAHIWREFSCCWGKEGGIEYALALFSLALLCHLSNRPSHPIPKISLSFPPSLSFSGKKIIAWLSLEIYEPLTDYLHRTFCLFFLAIGYIKLCIGEEREKLQDESELFLIKK